MNMEMSDLTLEHDRNHHQMLRSPSQRLFFVETKINISPTTGQLVSGTLHQLKMEVMI